MSAPRRLTLEQRLNRPRIGHHIRYVDPRELDGTAGDKYGTSPTLREIEIFLALLEHSTIQATAAALGIHEQTLKNHVGSVIARLGARNRTHATWLLWPVLKDAFDAAPTWANRFPCRDRRAGYQRRTA